MKFPPNPVNIGTGTWKLQPEVKTQGGSSSENYFSAPPELILTPAQPQVTVDIAYRPLRMTKPDDTREDGTVISDVHKGSLFIATPDGRAYVYELKGKSNPPTIDQKIEVEVACKTEHTQAIPIQNWLSQRQRFNARLTLVNPPPTSEDANAVKLSGIDLFDLPPNLKREYKFKIYSYKQLPEVLVLAEFENPSSGEYLKVEVRFKFTEPKRLGLIRFETPCRQVAKWPVRVANPLSNKAVSFECTANIEDIWFGPHGATFTVPAGGEELIEVCYRPSKQQDGEGEGEVLLKCPELGTYPYRVTYLVTSPAMEKPSIFKSPLGMSVVETARFWHYSKKPATYTAKIETLPTAAPGEEKRLVDFSVETKEIKAATAGPVELRVDVKYQPSSLQEMRAILVLSSPDAGEYKSMLIGYAQPPGAQGPFNIGKGKTENIEFRNPFHDASTFTFSTDNPDDFGLKQAGKQKIEGLKSLSVGVEFRGNVGVGSRLVVSHESLSTPWIYFLNGLV